MYVTVQFIILELLLGLIFLVILYFMLRELLKKIIRKELREIKEPLQVLANYLVEQSEQPQEPEDTNDDPSEGPGGGSSRSAKGPLPVVSPEKLPEEPVDIANEFNQLKNTNRVSAYNIRVQKIWDLYKHQKITLVQYKDELSRLKKEFGIPMEQEDLQDKEQSKEQIAKALVKPGGTGSKVKPLTPTPSAAPKQKVKKIDTGTSGNPAKEPHKNNEKGNETENGNENETETETGKSAANSDAPAMDPRKDNKAARLDD